MMIKGQRARALPGSLCSDRLTDGARYGNGGLTQRTARMLYVVTGRETARIEGEPGYGPGDFMNPDLDNAHVLVRATNHAKLTGFRCEQRGMLK